METFNPRIDRSICPNGSEDLIHKFRKINKRGTNLKSIA